MKTKNIDSIDGGSAAEVMALSIFRDLMRNADAALPTALTITRINNEPAKYGNLWWGDAVEAMTSLSGSTNPGAIFTCGAKKGRGCGLTKIHRQQPGDWFSNRSGPRRLSDRAVYATKPAGSPPAGFSLTGDGQFCSGSRECRCYHVVGGMTHATLHDTFQLAPHAV